MEVKKELTRLYSWINALQKALKANENDLRTLNKQILSYRKQLNHLTLEISKLKSTFLRDLKNLTDQERREQFEVISKLTDKADDLKSIISVFQKDRKKLLKERAILTSFLTLVDKKIVNLSRLVCVTNYN